MIAKERIQELNNIPEADGKQVVYWMQQAQRESDNHALEFAIAEANRRGVPVRVVFCLTAGFPEANKRHYAFMADGLGEVARRLLKRGITFQILHGDPKDQVVAASVDARILVTDRGYLRIQKQWRDAIANAAPCRVVQVETDVVVPVEIASQKEEYAARTIRPKIHRHAGDFLKLPARQTVQFQESTVQVIGFDPEQPRALLDGLSLDQSVPPSLQFKGGEAEAERRLKLFLREKLSHYDSQKSDPGYSYESDLSPYLHFGHISPIRIALAIHQSRADKENRDAFLEELLVRRELSMNFVHYNPGYDTYDAIPGWARQTLARHVEDRREYTYSAQQLETGETHDEYWNAAQIEMVKTGKMHNYMRMYWGKKIIEWSGKPEDAFATALYLNNKYELDGRDPNSFTGVAWCFGKHDRPWKERAIFGTVRYMSEGGLRRKFNMREYVDRVGDRLK